MIVGVPLYSIFGCLILFISCATWLCQRKILYPQRPTDILSDIVFGYPFGLEGEDLDTPLPSHKTIGPNLSLYKEFPPSKPDLYKKLVPTQGKMSRTELNQLYKKVAQLSWLT